jgi:hypothetical protein
MQFESHLGHDVFPRQRGSCFDVLTKLVVVSLWRLVRGLGLTAAVAYGGVWVAGSESWLVGSPLAVTGFARSSFRCCRVGPWWPTPIHGRERQIRHDVADVVRKVFLVGSS